MCLRLIAFFLIAACLPSTCAAQFASEGVRAKVDAVFAAYHKPDSPGCALGVIQEGKLIYTRGYGMSNLEHNLPITSKSVFDIGSTSKQFTAASIMLLAQQGKLALDDDIRKLLPEIPSYGKPVTIRQMLHHTSGLRDYLTLFSLSGVDFDGVTNDRDALQIIARQKALNFAPNDEHLYSNSGYFLLSTIVKRASGKSLREFAQENIFGPLGMNNTHFHDDHTMIVPQRATGYASSERGGFQISMSGFEQTGDGAVQTSVEDLLLWDQNFYSGKVGGKQMLEQMQTPGALNSGEKLTYAFGLVANDYRGVRMVSHGGSWAGYRAELARAPAEQFSVICLCNMGSADPSALARRVADVYLADKLKPVQARAAAMVEGVAVPEAELKKKVGLYRNAQTGSLRRITLRDGKLRVDQFRPNSFELAPLSINQFRVVGAPVMVDLAFESPQPGAPMQLKIIRQDEGSKPETLDAVAAASPTAADLAAYAGGYYSEELDTKYTVAVDVGKLSVRIKDGEPQSLQPTYTDAFIGPGGLQFEFSRDAQKRVTGFNVQAGRVRNIQFTRQGS